MMKIFIDAGHGGADSGAVGNGLREKNVNLAIALKIRNLLNRGYEGHQLKLSRTKDVSLSLKQRTDMANHWRANYLLSIHVNAGGGTGFESYIYNGIYAGKGKTDQLRSIIHNKIMEQSGFKDRGKKEANFHMLRESSMSACLTENGFIDNHTDASKLKTDAYLNKVAIGHVVGLAKALGLKRKPEANLGDTSNSKIHTIKKGTHFGVLHKRRIQR